MSAQRVCPIHGCNVAIDKSLLMCRAHFAMLSPDLRRQVYRWAHNPQMHTEACQKAIADVDEKESVKLEAGRQQFLL